jgi:hypothetical protein
MSNTLGASGTLGGAVAVALFWLWPVLRGRAPSSPFRGADGKSSTSKLQFFLWTSVVLFSYVGTFVQRCALGQDRTRRHHSRSLNPQEKSCP